MNHKKHATESWNSKYKDIACKHCGEKGGIGKCYDCDNLQCSSEGCRHEKGINDSFNYAVMEEGSFWCDDCLEKKVDKRHMEYIKRKYPGVY